MAESIDNARLERLVRSFEPNGRLVRAWDLKGGVSAQVTAFEIQRVDGEAKLMVLRRYGPNQVRQNPHAAEHEFELLRVLQSLSLAVPTPFHLDHSGEIFPEPLVVVEYIEGDIDFTPSDLPGFTCQIAAYLSKLHAVNSLNPDLAFLPKQEDIVAQMLVNRPALADESLSEGRIRYFLESVRPLPQRNVTALLHGDFWPGNILWKDGRLVAVIDWEDAAIGDPLADVANSRLEILWACGADAMQDFTQNYQEQTRMDLADLPYWDLVAALRPAGALADWGLDHTVESAMRERHRAFVNQAFDQLESREEYKQHQG